MIKSIRIPIYEQILEIYVGHKAIDKAGKLYSVLDTDSIKTYRGYATHLEHSETKEARFIICFPNLEDTLPGTIAHECGHIAMQLFAHVGAKVSPKDDEAYMYLLTWLVNNVTDILNIFKQRRDEMPTNKTLNNEK